MYTFSKKHKKNITQQKSENFDQGKKKFEKINDKQSLEFPKKKKKSYSLYSYILLFTLLY